VTPLGSGTVAQSVLLPAGAGKVAHHPRDLRMGRTVSPVGIR